MKLHKLPKLNIKKLKRIGRGPGSGKGKTSGRGTKGQNARHKLPITHSHYEGGQRPLTKRIPFRRGKGNSKVSTKPIIVNLESLNSLPKNSTVNKETLIKANIVDKNQAKTNPIKILSDGQIKVALTIDLPISKTAAEKITKAGGKIINVIKQ